MKKEARGRIRESTPLVTALDDGRWRLTFVWDEALAATGDRDPVAVTVRVSGLHDHHAGEMLHLRREPASGVWTGSVVAPAKFVGSYQLHVVDAQTWSILDLGPHTRGPRVRELWRRLSTRQRLDPTAALSPLHSESGRIRLPGAPEEPGWVEPPDRSGSGWSDPGQWTGHDGRRVWHAWCGAPDPTARLVVLTDGEVWSRIDLPEAVSRLVADGKLPPTLLAAVDTAPDRMVELGHNPAFEELLADSLLPELASVHGLAQTPERTVISGQSLGGLTAVGVALRHPDRVGNALSCSGSFWWPDWDGGAGGALAAELASGRFARADTRFHLACGELEPRMVEHQLAMVSALRARGHAVRGSTSCHGHDLAAWRGAMTRGLLSLLG